MGWSSKDERSKMTAEYTSPVIGDIPEELYYAIDLSIDEFLEQYTLIRHRRAMVIPAILRVEKKLSGMEIKGSTIYTYLIQYGFSESVSMSALRIFAAHDEVISVLKEIGFDEYSMIYDYTYLSKLKKANFEKISIWKSYALESYINVRPIRVEEELPPPPPEYYYRSQATFTYSKGKKRVEMRVYYQSEEPIEEQTLIDKWNEAMDNANNLPRSNLGPLLDRLEEDPGYEPNMEIERDEIIGKLGTWYGKIIFTDKASGSTYPYDVL